MKYIVIILFLFFITASHAQEALKDSLALPFAIAKEKKLSADNLQNKKEGLYVVGGPYFSSDPMSGFGYGAIGSVFFNDKRTDPFFNYTPYRSELDVVLFNTTRYQRQLKAVYDMPYIFDSKWRFRAKVWYESNPNLLYFGQTEKSLEGLSYYPNGDTSQPKVYNATYDDYVDNLPADSKNYNSYLKQEYHLDLSFEYSFWEGKLRTLIGFEVDRVNVTTFEGKSLLQEENSISPVQGLGQNTYTLLHSGLVYDTRDLETDPSKGIFSELINELSVTALGSGSNFDKSFFHFNWYKKLFPSTFGRMILATRFAYGYTAGDAPFFQYQSQWGTERVINGLGGPYTLRGYKQGRFSARAMNFNTVELRTRFAETDFLKQHLVFSAVPFLEMGGVWDEFKNSFSFNNFRFSQGLGLRMAWNVNTILRFDFATSKEDKQFFFNIGHTF